MEQQRWTATHYSDWLAKHVRVDRRSYRERLSSFLDRGRPEGANLLLLFGHGGAGKTVLTETLDAAPARAGHTHGENWLRLRLDFDRSRAAAPGQPGFETLIGRNEQTDFAWSACLHKFRLQVTLADRPGDPERSKAMPAFADFYDHCVSPDDTEGRRARRLGLPAAFAILAALVFATFSALPDLLEEIAGLSLSRELRIVFLAATVTLPLLALPQVKRWAWKQFVANPRYRRLGVRPTDFHEAGRDQSAAGRPVLPDETLTAIFLSDLAGWLARKRHLKGVVFLVDLHDFTADMPARLALWRGLHTLATGALPEAKSSLRDKIRVVAASKFRPLDTASEADWRQSSVSVTNLEPAEAVELVRKAIGGLRTEPGALAAAAGDTVLGALSAGDGSGEAGGKGPGLVRDLVSLLAFGTAPDASVNPQSEAIEVRDRLAAFLASPVAQAAASDRAALQRLKTVIEDRERQFLEDAFDSREAFYTACFLASFECGLSEQDWVISDEAILPFNALKERPSLFEPVGEAAPEDCRMIVRPAVRARLCAGGANYRAAGGRVWTLLGQKFGTFCRDLDLESTEPADPGPDTLLLARKALSCLAAAADQQAYHQHYPFPDTQRLAVQLLGWIERACPLLEGPLAADGRLVLEDAAIVCLQLAAPARAPRGQGLLGHAELRGSALGLLDTYLRYSDTGDASGSSRFQQVPASVRLRSNAAMGRLEQLAQMRSIGEEEAGRLDSVLNLLRALHRTGSRQDQVLAEMRAAYAQRRLRAPEQTVRDFERFRSIGLQDFSGGGRIAYASLLRKMASSIASIEVSTPAPGDEVARLGVFNRFVGAAIARIEEIKTECDDPSSLWRLAWFQLRARLYWTQALLMRGEDVFVAKPATLLDDIEALVRELLETDGMPDLADLAELRSTADAFARDGRLNALADTLKAAETGMYRKGLEQRIAQAGLLLAGRDQKDFDWNAASIALASLTAQTFLRGEEDRHASDAGLAALRQKARRLYAQTVIANWRARAGRSAASASLDTALEAFVRPEYQAEPQPAGESGKRYTDPDFVQNLLTVLACLNPDVSEAGPGSLLIARVEEICPPGPDGAASSPRVRLSVPHSDLEIGLEDGLLPPDLFLESRLRRGEADPARRRTQLYEHWSGKLLPVILLAKGAGPAWPATARGIQYATSLLQLFCPPATSWNALETHQRDGSNSRPLAWMGASNSWLTVRADEAWIQAVLANGGAFSRQLPLLTSVTRLTYFTTTSDAPLPDSDAREEEIRRFVSAAYRDLSVDRDETGRLVFHHRNYVGNSETETGQDPFSHQKNRTFLSMFRKVFQEDATIHGWDDPAADDPVGSAFGTAGKSGPATPRLDEGEQMAAYDMD